MFLRLIFLVIFLFNFYNISYSKNVLHILNGTKQNAILEKISNTETSTMLQLSLQNHYLKLFISKKINEHIDLKKWLKKEILFITRHRPEGPIFQLFLLSIKKRYVLGFNFNRKFKPIASWDTVYKKNNYNSLILINDGKLNHINNGEYIICKSCEHNNKIYFFDITNNSTKTNIKYNWLSIVDF